jgi:hypothetical protein
MSEANKQAESGSGSSVWYLVRYPSGKSFTLQGRFALTPLESCLMPCVFQDDNKVAMLDQRAIVEHDGVEVYSPRRNREWLQPEMSRWLHENESWAR